jgi:fatty acid desaturase
MDLRVVLSEQGIDALRTRNNWAGARIIAFDWSMIIGTFWITAQFPNPLTIALAVTLLGGRQLALGIIVHETGHRSLFTDQPVNDFCGNWLAGYWVFSDKDAYMHNHPKHHQFASTLDEPDLPNYNDYPVSTLSLKRKITRDLTGQVGWRHISAIARSIARLPRLKPNIRQTVIRSLALNLTMLLVMSALGVP